MVTAQFVGLSFFPIVLALGVIWLRIQDVTVSLQLLFLFALSFIGFIASMMLIPPVSQLCLKAKMFGKDINKGSTNEV